jgi:CRP-like cAMP-binding protein
MTATRNSQLLRLSREAIMETLHEEPAAALRLLEILAARLRATNNLVEVSTSLDLGARLARILLEAERRETRSQSELARIASASRESVNRKLSQWRAVGWVDIGAAGIAVTDRAALKREAKLDE